MVFAYKNSKYCLVLCKYMILNLLCWVSFNNFFWLIEKRLQLLVGEGEAERGNGRARVINVQTCVGIRLCSRLVMLLIVYYDNMWRNIFSTRFWVNWCEVSNDHFLSSWMHERQGWTWGIYFLTWLLNKVVGKEYVVVSMRFYKGHCFCSSQVLQSRRKWLPHVTEEKYKPCCN